MKIFGGQRYLIYGDGVSGRSAYRAVVRCGGKAKIYSDRCGKFYAPKKRYDFAVISPGIKPTHDVYKYCADNNIEVMGEVQLGLSMAGGSKTVAVTGTNGKTTTTRLIAAMLGGVACGNIGYPVTAAVEKNPEYLTVEVSSFQLYNAKIAPDVAVITNIASDHIDWHGSLEQYRKCKCNIANGMRGGYLVLGEDIPVGALEYLNTGAEIVRCATSGTADGAYVSDGYFCFNGKRVCPVDYMRLSGTHNIKNALCAIAAAKLLGAENGAILGALSTAEPAPHRMADIGAALGKRWIDDSKSTNVSSCLAAVGEMTGNTCLIVGGRDKDLDFTELFSALGKNVTSVVAMGESAQKLRDSALEVGYRGVVTVVDGLTAAVKAAAKSDAEVVLLSPACASFDEFDGYGARGDKFVSEVRSLEKRQ